MKSSKLLQLLMLSLVVLLLVAVPVFSQEDSLEVKDSPQPLETVDKENEDIADRYENMPDDQKMQIEIAVLNRQEFLEMQNQGLPVLVFFLQPECPHC